MADTRHDKTASYIHYNPERTDYSVTPEELELLKDAANNHWKDFFLVSFTLGLSCLLNAISATSLPFKLDLSLFLNYLIGFLGIGGSFPLYFAWQDSSKKTKTLLDRIESKPKYLVALTQSGGSPEAVQLICTEVIPEPVVADNPK